LLELGEELGHGVTRPIVLLRLPFLQVESEHLSLDLLLERPLELEHLELDLLLSYLPLFEAGEENDENQEGAQLVDGPRPRVVSIEQAVLSKVDGQQEHDEEDACKEADCVVEVKDPNAELLLGTQGLILPEDSGVI